jgi:hypothetical protein
VAPHPSLARSRKSIVFINDVSCFFFLIDDAIRLRAGEGFRLEHSIILEKVGMRLLLSRSMLYLLNILPSLVGARLFVSLVALTMPLPPLLSSPAVLVSITFFVFSISTHSFIYLLNTGSAYILTHSVRNSRGM